MKPAALAINYTRLTSGREDAPEGSSEHDHEVLVLQFEHSAHLDQVQERNVYTAFTFGVRVGEVAGVRHGAQFARSRKAEAGTGGPCAREAYLSSCICS